MPNLFKKISDYDRLAHDLEERTAEVLRLGTELEKTKAEVESLQARLVAASQKAKDERRKRAEEEMRRGSAERDLEAKAKALGALQAQLVEYENLRREPDTVAILDSEAEIEPSAVLSFVGDIEFGYGAGCLSAYVTGDNAESFLSTLPGMRSWATRLGGSGRGIVAFVSGRRACILEPPLPVESESIGGDEAFDFEGLGALLQERPLGFVSIHRDQYAVCILDGGSKECVFEVKDVVGRSKKGGFSQARYARSREDQFKHLVAEVNSVASHMFSKGVPEYVLVEGDDLAVSALSGSSGLLGKVKLVRFKVQRKVDRDLLEELPGLAHTWKAWVFELPTQLHPSG